MRSFISPAALLVKVTAKMRSGAHAVRSRSGARSRAVSTRVLPEPAPASTSSGPCTCSTASRWAGFSGRAAAWSRGSGLVLERERRCRKQAPVGVGSRVEVAARARPRATRVASARPMPQPPVLVVMPGSKRVRRMLARRRRGRRRSRGATPCRPSALDPEGDGAARAPAGRRSRSSPATRAPTRAGSGRPSTVGPAPGGLDPELDRVGVPRAAGAGSSPPRGRPARPARSARAAPALPIRSKRCATRSSRSASAIRCSARSAGGVGRERTTSIQPCRLMSGVPIWCAASRAMATQTRSRCDDHGVPVREGGHADHDRHGQRLRAPPAGPAAAGPGAAPKCTVPEPGLDDRRVHAIELARRTRCTRGSSSVGVEREVGEGGHLPHAVGDDERHAQLPDVLAELEQRAGLRARRGSLSPAKTPA